MKNISNGINGVDLGVFTPTSEWNAVLLLEATSFGKALEVFMACMKKHGPHPKIPLAKRQPKAITAPVKTERQVHP